MEGDMVDDNHTGRFDDKVDYPVLESSALENENKKDPFWTGGMMKCLSSLFSLFKRAELKCQGEDQWKFSFSSITDLVYLGSGAQGVVFGGNLRGEMVAVKKLRDGAESDVKHLRKLNHENIVGFRGVCCEPPTFCIVMEFCQYGPLFEFLHSGVCFNPKQIMKWAKEISQGMSYLHNNNIIHRDLKSPNVLIADNLVVKVSDFGTSREWNDESATMSFTGTVAWMAPEVIRHEPCSERVDVWSYGVVLWELLTLEIPYKNLEGHAVMWGVGTDTISLPIPPSCPDSLQLLMQQCWNRVPRNRPPFKIITAHLEIAGKEIENMHEDCFSAVQATWRKEAKLGMDKLYARPEHADSQGAHVYREDEKNTRYRYEQQLCRANELYMEVCAIRLQLEQREKAIAERENALKDCHCGSRKNFKRYQHQTSTSSDGLKAPLVGIQAFNEAAQRRRKKKQAEENGAVQVVVNLVDAKAQESQKFTIAVSEENGNERNDVVDMNIDKIVSMKDTFIEANGNALNDTVCRIQNAANDYSMPDVTQV